MCARCVWQKLIFKASSLLLNTKTCSWLQKTSGMGIFDAVNDLYFAIKSSFNFRMGITLDKFDYAGKVSIGPEL